MIKAQKRTAEKDEGAAADWLGFASSHRQLRLEFEDILSYQAMLLDQDRLEEWLDLLAEDVRYMVPVRQKIKDERANLANRRALCHSNDGKPGLSLRVGRIRTGFAHYNNLHALVRNLVTNVRILDVQNGGELVQVASNFAVFRAREEKEETAFVGGRTDTWRRTDGKWLLVHRLVELNHHFVPPISVLF